MMAQFNTGALQQFRENHIYLQQQKSNSWLETKRDTTTLELLKRLSLSPRKPGIYALPQDNMPCIIPDLSGTVAIPNLWKGKTKVPYKSSPPLIPNPLRISPSRPLLTFPEESTR
jgi:hypothetical protein